MFVCIVFMSLQVYFVRNLGFCVRSLQKKKNRCESRFFQNDQIAVVRQGDLQLGDSIIHDEEAPKLNGLECSLCLR